jgi:hypothetical protein
MLNQVINVVAELRTFLIVCAVVSLVMGGFLLIFCRKFSFDGKNLKTIGFFYQMQTWDILALAVGIAKVCLFISLFITVGKVSNAYIGVYIFLHVVYIVHRRDVKGLVGDLFGGVASCGVMSIMGMLYNYLHDVMFDWRIQVVIVLMMIIICGYALRDMFCTCARIIMIPREKEDKDEQ